MNKEEDLETVKAMVEVALEEHFSKRMDALLDEKMGDITTVNIEDGSTAEEDSEITMRHIRERRLANKVEGQSMLGSSDYTVGDMRVLAKMMEEHELKVKQKKSKCGWIAFLFVGFLLAVLINYFIGV